MNLLGGKGGRRPVRRSSDQHMRAELKSMGSVEVGRGVV